MSLKQILYKKNMAEHKRQRQQNKKHKKEKQNETDQVQLKKRFLFFYLFLFINFSILLIFFSNKKSYFCSKPIPNWDPSPGNNYLFSYLLFSYLLFSSLLPKIIKEKIKEVEENIVQLEKEKNQRFILQ